MLVHRISLIFVIIFYDNAGAQKYYYKRIGPYFEIVYGEEPSMEDFKEVKSPKVLNYHQLQEEMMVCHSAAFSCPGGPYPRSTTEQFECSADPQCPENYKCCRNNCFQHKICQQAIPRSGETKITSSSMTDVEIVTEATTKSPETESSEISDVTLSTGQNADSISRPRTIITDIPENIQINTKKTGYSIATNETTVGADISIVTSTESSTSHITEENKIQTDLSTVSSTLVTSFLTLSRETTGIETLSVITPTRSSISTSAPIPTTNRNEKNLTEIDKVLIPSTTTSTPNVTERTTIKTDLLISTRETTEKGTLSESIITGSTSTGTIFTAHETAAAETDEVLISSSTTSTPNIDETTTIQTVLLISTIKAMASPTPSTSSSTPTRKKTEKETLGVSTPTGFSTSTGASISTHEATATGREKVLIPSTMTSIPNINEKTKVQTDLPMSTIEEMVSSLLPISLSTLIRESTESKTLNVTTSTGSSTSTGASISTHVATATGSDKILIPSIMTPSPNITRKTTRQSDSSIEKMASSSPPTSFSTLSRGTTESKTMSVTTPTSSSTSTGALISTHEATATGTNTILIPSIMTPSPNITRKTTRQSDSSMPTIEKMASSSPPTSFSTLSRGTTESMTMSVITITSSSTSTGASISTHEATATGLDKILIPSTMTPTPNITMKTTIQSDSTMSTIEEMASSSLPTSFSTLTRGTTESETLSITTPIGSSTSTGISISTQKATAATTDKILIPSTTIQSDSLMSTIEEMASSSLPTSFSTLTRETTESETLNVTTPTGSSISIGASISTHKATGTDTIFIPSTMIPTPNITEKTTIQTDSSISTINGTASSTLPNSFSTPTRRTTERESLRVTATTDSPMSTSATVSTISMQETTAKETEVIISTKSSRLQMNESISAKYDSIDENDIFSEMEHSPISVYSESLDQENVNAMSTGRRSPTHVQTQTYENSNLPPLERNTGKLKLIHGQESVNTTKDTMKHIPQANHGITSTPLSAFASKYLTSEIIETMNMTAGAVHGSIENSQNSDKTIFNYPRGDEDSKNGFIFGDDDETVSITQRIPEIVKNRTEIDTTSTVTATIGEHDGSGSGSYKFDDGDDVDEEGDDDENHEDGSGSRY